jgi:DNA-directed RNA polymerase beta' subunit
MKLTIIFAGILVMVFGFVSLTSAQAKISRIKKEQRIRQDEKPTNLELEDKLQSKENKTNANKMAKKVSSGDKQIGHRKESQICRQICNIYSSIDF